VTGMEDRLAQLRQRFLADCAEQAQAIRSAMDAREWMAVRDLCHSLSGRAGMFGFAAVGLAAQRLEERIDEDASEDERRRLAGGLLERLDGLPQGR
jgi:HPt (histidine-containing phosphotransfer) domain-containing protein